MSAPAVAQGVEVPRLLYGTAWKEGETARLVGLALAAGFRGIDTANQRKHYVEAAVGEAVQSAIKEGTVNRRDLFLQSKFTHVGGQDHRLPYDAKAPQDKQVAQSLASSLQHLGVDVLDAFLLHGPSVSVGWAQGDWQAWGAIEDLHRAGQTRLIGVSNVSADQLLQLHEAAAVKPHIVQNRCFTRPHADRKVRDFCRANGIVYEGFSLLTGHGLVQHPAVHAIAKRIGATNAQVVFRYCLDRGLHVLTGTTSAGHMAHDLAIEGLQLDVDEALAMDRVLGWV